MKLCDMALYSLETSSGVRTYIENKVRFINEQPEAISHVLLVPANKDGVAIQGRSKIYFLRGVPCFYPKLRLVVNIARAARIIEAEAPDLIEVNCQYTLPWAAFLGTRKSRVPVVGVYHFDLPACVRVITRNAGWPISHICESLARFYVGLLYRQFTQTIILNESIAPTMERLGVHRLSVIPCGVDTTTFGPHQRDRNLKQKLGIPANQKIILYVGRLSPEKELDLLLSAYARLSNREYALVIVGEGPERDKIAKYSAIQSGVKYLGHLDSPHELARIYASSDLFAMPCRNETFCMAAIEAMASGLPVVAITNGALSDLITPEIGALAQPGDEQDLADKIALVSNWGSDLMRQRCSSYATTRFSWDKVFTQYFELYRDLIPEQKLMASEKK